jgi:RNA 3'-terminal phosphate cyclase
VHAAARLGSAQVEGAKIGSGTLMFRPGIEAGDLWSVEVEKA